MGFNVWPTYSYACQEAVGELLANGGSLSAYRANPQVGSGPKEGSYAWKLEREIEAQFKVAHAVVTNSGTAALHCALKGIDLDGGEVVTSPFTFSATSSAIQMAGGRPVYADVDPDTYCITKETVKRVLSKKTKAVLPVHLFGGQADVQDLQTLGLPVVEDACQAVGAHRGHSYSGTLGVAGAYSFNGGKNVPAGECGAFVTNDPRAAELGRLLGNHAENFGDSRVGFNYRPNEVTCCIAYHGLLELKDRNLHRIQLAQALSVMLEDLDVKVPHTFDGSHVYYVYPFRVPKNRKKFIEAMSRRGIDVGAGYIQPTLDEYPAFKRCRRGDLSGVKELSKRSLCILSQVNPSNDILHMKEISEAMHLCLPKKSRLSSRAG